MINNEKSLSSDTVTFKPVAIVPHYNHSGTLPLVVERLLAEDLPVIVVDDGSTAEEQQNIQHLAQLPKVDIVFLPDNLGKGGAMKKGFFYAFERGFTHGLQIDADAQHCFDDIKTILNTAQIQPQAIICGNPVYGDDAPKSRLYGRKITNFWNILHTHSFDIKDGMCGFRLYPLFSVIQLLTHFRIGNRMDFDTDILVRAHWQQIPLHWFDTPVQYQKNGISHFRGWHDNWLITKMHTKLFFTMLIRFITGKPL